MRTVPLFPGADISLCDGPCFEGLLGQFPGERIPAGTFDPSNCLEVSLASFQGLSPLVVGQGAIAEVAYWSYLRSQQGGSGRLDPIPVVGRPGGYCGKFGEREILRTSDGGLVLRSPFVCVFGSGAKPEFVPVARRTLDVRLGCRLN